LTVDGCATNGNGKTCHRASSWHVLPRTSWIGTLPPPHRRGRRARPSGQNRADLGLDGHRLGSLVRPTKRLTPLGVVKG